MKIVDDTLLTNGVVKGFYANMWFRAKVLNEATPEGIQGGRTVELSIHSGLNDYYPCLYKYNHRPDYHEVNELPQFIVNGLVAKLEALPLATL